MSAPLPILLSAAEPSSKSLATEFLRHYPGPVVGMLPGGCERIETIASPPGEAMMGASLSLRGIWQLRRAQRGLLKGARERKPSVAMLFNYTEFHLRLAPQLRRLGWKVVLVACPQFWAWRPRRGRALAQQVDHVACLFKFESKLLAHAGVAHTWVGHPLGDVRGNLGDEKRGGSPGPQGAGERALALDLALVPGSRLAELQRLLPIFEAALVDYRSGFLRQNQRSAPPRVGLFASGNLSPAAKRLVGSFCRRAEVGQHVAPSGRLPWLLGNTQRAWVCSGTASLESALAGANPIIVYRASPLVAPIARRLIRTPFVGLPNLLLRREQYPELVQGALQPETLAALSLSKARPQGKSRAGLISQLRPNDAPFGKRLAALCSHVKASSGGPLDETG